MKSALIKAGKYLAKMLIGNGKGEEENTKRKAVIGFVIGCLCFFLLVPAITISLPGVLLKEGWNKVTGFFEGVYTFFGGDLEEYDLYKDIRDTYINYIEDLNEKINEEISEVRNESSYMVTEEVKTLDEKTGKYNSKEISYRVYPEIIKNITLEKPRYSHLMAYIAVKYIYNQGLDEDNQYKLDKKEAKEFLNYIMKYEQNHYGTDPVYFNAKTTVLDIEEIADHYFSDKYERGQFITSFQSIQNDEEELVKDLYNYIDLSMVNVHEKGMQIPHLLQSDEAWKDIVYRDETIETKGAAPVCLAMVVSYLKGEIVRPDEVVGKVTEKYTNEWRIFEEVGKEYGIKCKNIGKSQASIISALEEGKPVIAYMKKGEYSSYIVIREITSDKKIYINDPNDIYTVKDLYLKRYNINEIYTNSNTFFVFN